MSNDQITLGAALQVTLSVNNLQANLPFYQLMGFKKVAESNQPNPWIQLTDGVILLLLNEDKLGYLGLTYFSADLDARVAHFESKGVVFDHKTNKEGRVWQAIRMDVNDIGLALIAYDPELIYRPAGSSFANCGKFGELALVTKDLDRDIEIWTQLGFILVVKSQEPNPWAIMSDEMTVIGLHQTDMWQSPALTYFSPDMAGRIMVLKEMGLKPTFESPNEQGVTGYAGFLSPDGCQFFLFEGDV